MDLSKENLGIKKVEVISEIQISIPIKFSLNLPSIMTHDEIKRFVSNHYKEIVSIDKKDLGLSEDAVIKNDGNMNIKINVEEV